MEAPTIRLTLSEDEKEILRRRIPEAAAWAAQVAPGPLTTASLRTRELMPERYSDELWSLDQPSDLVRGWFAHVSGQRSKGIEERALRVPSLESALESGFILAHHVGACMMDELPAGKSPFFDRLDNTAWDTWPLVVEQENDPVWLSWIDRSRAAEVDAAAWMTTTQCLSWVDPEHLGQQLQPREAERTSLDRLILQINLAFVAIILIAQFFVRIPVPVALVGGALLFLANLAISWRAGRMSGVEGLSALLLVVGIGTWFWLNAHHATWEAMPRWVFLLFVLPGLLLLIASKWNRKREDAGG